MKLVLQFFCKSGYKNVFSKQEVFSPNYRTIENSIEFKAK